MAYKEVLELSADKTVKVGGEDGPSSIEGYFLGTRVIKTKDSTFKDSRLHILVTQEGNVGVWGTSKLDALMLTVKPGEMTMITYIGRGLKQKGKQPAYLYKVMHDADNTIDVEGLKAANTPVESSQEDSNEGESYEPDSNSDVEEEEEKYKPSYTAASHTQTKSTASQPTTETQRRVAELIKNRR